MDPRIAVTGAASFLGARLLRRLAEAGGPERLLAVDIAAPPPALGIPHHFLDLTEPAADQRLLETLAGWPAADARSAADALVARWAEAKPALLAAITLSMLVAPFLIRHNKRIARVLLRQDGPERSGLERIEAANLALARREHVILCGYGRVGQNVARVLEGEGFEFLAMDLDPMRVRRWPTEEATKALFAEAAVAADEFLASAAGDLTLAEMVTMLGRRADGLAEAWNAWGRIRPLLLAEG